MKISEFEKEKEKIDALALKKDTLIKEMERVQNVLENVDEVVSDLDNQFSERTGILNKTDMSFLFIAIMLQSLRWILSPELKIPQIGQLGEEELRVAKTERLESNVKNHKGGIYDGKSSGKAYEDEKINRYFDKHKEKYEKAQKEYNGDKGRDTHYRTWIEIMLRAVPYDAMKAMDDYTIPNIAGLNKYNEDAKIYSNIYAKNHHVATLGHDPVLGWIFGTMNIMSSTITFCDFKTYDVVQTNPTLNKWNQQINYAKRYSLGEMLEYCINSGIEDNKRIPAAVARQAMHFASDKYCTEGLPIPLLSAIDPQKTQKLIEQGWNSREFDFLAQHDLGVIGANAIISILINEILKAIYLCCIELDETNPRLKEVRIRKVLTVANLIVSTSNVVFTSVTGCWEKLDIGGIGVSLIQLFTTPKFIDEVKQEFIAAGIEQAIMGDGDWLQYALKENPNMSKREELINQGRHQIADPMAKKMEQLKDGADNVLSSTINAVDRQNTMLKQVVTEGKDKSLGIKRLTSFADLSEEHDIDIVHKVLDKYCVSAIAEMNQTTKQFRIGLNESKRFFDYNNSLDSSYEFLLAELEDKEIASRLLFEIISLYNCFVDGDYDKEEYENLLAELIISQKERNNIKHCIEACYLDYSISKWIEILLAGYTSDEREVDEIQEEDIRCSCKEGVFDEVDLINLQYIMDKYGIIKDTTGYKELATEVFSVLPDAYLGRIDSRTIYFTTEAIYAKLSSGKWETIRYAEVYPEGIINEPMDKGEVELTIPDINGYRFGYIGSKEECDKLTALLYEMKNVKTSAYDEYSPIWADDNMVYAEILVDFLKLGQHCEIAALVKASEILDIEDDEEDIRFEEFCKYGLSQYTVTMEDIKEKILSWRETLDAHAVNLSMAILIKDLIEVLQLATGEPTAMTSVEKYFFDWLLKEAKIEDGDEFLEMIRLPYYLISPNRDIAISFDKLVSVEKYAHEIQMHIPYHILDNEKNGLWSEIYGVSQEYNRHLFMTKNNKELIKEKLDYSAVMELSSICVSMYEFLLGAWSVEPAIIEWEEFESFIEGCIFDEDANEVKTKLLELLSDKDWIPPQDEILGYDRRNVGKKMIDELWQKK